MTEVPTDSPPDDDESLLRTRLQLYGVYDTEQEMRQELEKFHVGVHVDSNNGMEDDDDYPSSQPSSGAANNNDTPNDTGSSVVNTMSTRQQTSSDRDIWGRFPLKEAKEMVQCPACKRSYSTLRLAMHLDKCLGIGTTVRSAAGALGTTSTRSAANQNK